MLNIFESCFSLTSVSFGNNVKIIPKQAFAYCENLSSVSIPNCVTRIGGWAFYKCKNLKTVNIGKGTSKIGKESFSNCPSLTDFFCYSEIPPSTSVDLFKDSNIENAILHVNAGSVDAYKALETWSSFKEIVIIPEK